MKKSNSILAIVAMAIVATAVAFVSCKKETENALIQRGNSTRRTIDISQIEDINVYLKEFRQKMTESKGNETMNFEDAAWHLTSLANIDLCQANVEFNDVRFDTIEMQIKTNEHTILLSDFRIIYEQIVSEIQRFQENLSLDNKNLRFVNVFLTNNGIARIIMMTTTNSVFRNLDNNLWYFPDTFCYIDSICLYYFTAPQYQWNTTAKSNLERVMNVFEGRITPHVSAYISTRTISFDFPDWKDSYALRLAIIQDCALEGLTTIFFILMKCVIALIHILV